MWAPRGGSPSGGPTPASPSSSVVSGKLSEKRLEQNKSELCWKHDILSKRAALQKRPDGLLACEMRLRRVTAGNCTKKLNRRWKSVAHIGGVAYSAGQKECCRVLPATWEHSIYQPKREGVVHTYQGGGAYIHTSTTTLKRKSSPTGGPRWELSRWDPCRWRRARQTRTTR